MSLRSQRGHRIEDCCLGASAPQLSHFPKLQSKLQHNWHRSTVKNLKHALVGKLSKLSKLSMYSESTAFLLLRFLLPFLLPWSITFVDNTLKTIVSTEIVSLNCQNSQQLSTLKTLKTLSFVFVLDLDRPGASSCVATS